MSRRSGRLAADLFVAERIKSAMTGKNDIGRFSKGLSVGTTLVTICFNLSVARMLKAFEVENLLAVNRNNLFWDQDDEHPNFELRMLLINAFIAANTDAEEATQKLVTDFKARRP